jgi:tRNA(Ile)-lysidine synthase
MELLSEDMDLFFENITGQNVTQPISVAEFESHMAACGPFEVKPRLAVAISGGSDSMALCLLADAWARSRGGEIVALTVDHGLRANSAAEALAVSDWLRPYGIAHHILPWTGVKPSHAIQQAARAARYRLLGDWCAAQGIMHLLVAHHFEDQAETYALRLQRGSGVDGLAAMAKAGRLPEHLKDAPLLLRPLLDVPKSRLVKYLESKGQPWVEDPSNQLDIYARVRLRKAFARAAPGDLTAAAAAQSISTMQHSKSLRQTASTRFLACHAEIDTAGYAAFDAPALVALPPEVASAVLAGLVMTLGGRIYKPRSDRLEFLYQALRSNTAGGWTLGGCQIHLSEGKVSIYREPANCRSELILNAGQSDFWDNRFRVGFAPLQEAAQPASIIVRKLGQVGWCDLVGLRPELRQSPIPYPVRLALPAFYSAGQMLAVPMLGYFAARYEACADVFTCQFDPARSISE